MLTIKKEIGCSSCRRARELEPRAGKYYCKKPGEKIEHFWTTLSCELCEHWLPSKDTLRVWIERAKNSL